MTENILQSYANHNLLDFEGGGNEEYTHLLKASEVLADEITNENIQAFALAAINPHINIENSQLQEVQKIIQEEWKFFVKSTKQTDIQRTILRVVVLNTLDYLIENDDKKAAILWLSCQHVYQYANIANKNEAKIIHDLIQKASERYSVLATEDFQIIAPEFGFDLPKVSSVKLPVNNERKADVILNKINDIPEIQSNVQKVNYTNIIYPSVSNFNTWYENFSSKLSTTLEELTTTEREAIKKYLQSVDKELKKVYQVFTEEIPNQIQTSLHSLSNNNNLIWWKETLFSNSLQDSYREKPDLVQVAAMAYDLAYDLNGYTPISVDFFLKETLQKVQPETTNVSLKDLSEKFLSEENEFYLSKVLPEKEIEKNTSLSLLDFLTAKFHQKSKTNIATAIGIDETKKLTNAELLVWLFHDFQALKLTQNG